MRKEEKTGENIMFPSRNIMLPGVAWKKLVPAGAQISLGIPSSSDVQIPESQDFLDIQARILGRQHGNSGSFLQPWNQKHKAVRGLL